MQNKQTAEDLRIMQSWSLQRKIQVTQTRILEWYLHYKGQAYISFSGGKDSTVLLDLARRGYPDIPAVFIDTGLEYPEIKAFVKTIENAITIRPEISFRKVVELYGYPVVSKKVSRQIRDLQNASEKNRNVCNLYLTGITSSGKECKSRKLADKWIKLTSAPFKCSEQCCDVLKKAPLHKYQKKTRQMPIMATMAEESRDRREAWFLNGCNAFEAKKPRSAPMSFWTEQDILQYLKITGIPYASVYGEIKENDDGTLCTTGVKRTGCTFCMFGSAIEKAPNRFQQMKYSHPKLYDYCIGGGAFDSNGIWKPTNEGLGQGYILDYCGIPYK